ncbi:hypothetical protein T01_10651 [Trichinella spiralis]|uniref:Uncharacterized protein n=1 Tax=Trichinella spiralis TaxID=6334 RepID=A0A0V1B6P7_TRISP|nr:hypothetical protein T01_10651 [Trichinella spiralis]
MATRVPKSPSTSRTATALDRYVFFNRNFTIKYEENGKKILVRVHVLCCVEMDALRENCRSINRDAV